MGKVTDTATTASRPAAHTSAPKVPTSEQLRMAQLLVDPKSEDHSILRDKVHKVMELTRCDENSALTALHDCDNDVEQAVVNLLEGDQQPDEWIVQEGKKAKKTQHHPNAEESPAIDEGDVGSKQSSNRRQRGTGARGGAIADGPSRLRGRSGGAGTARGTINKENDSYGDSGGGERGFSKGRGRGAKDNGDRGGRGRGFGARGGRRGGGGFHQSDGGGGGFTQIDSWNVATPDSNTWDNSMANTVSNGPAGEWGKRKNIAENNTWDNSMAHANIDYDWGGEEDWSKLRDGMVIEPSSTSKGPEKPLPSTAPTTVLAQETSPAPAPVQGDASRIRGESIDVNSLFGSNQPVAQQSASSSAMWTASKQATADLKNELGIGKMAPPVLGESTSHTHNNKDSIPSKLNAAKVELPTIRATASIGPIDVQFGDMTLGADSSHGLLDFVAASGYQQQNNTTPKDQASHQRPQHQVQHSVYQRAAAGDHVNGPDLLSSSRTTEVVSKDATPYPGAGSFATQPLEQQSMPQGAQQQKTLQQQAPAQQQQQFASNRVSHQNASQGPAMPQRPANSGNASGVSGEHQRSQLPPTATNAGPASTQQQQSGSDPVGVQQFSRDDHLVQMNMNALSNASTMPGLSKTQVSAGTAVSQPMGPYQQAMAGLFPYMALDQASLNYLQSQNILYNTGGYDIRTVNSLGGAGIGMGRADTGDMKTHMMRQENGSMMPPGGSAPTAGAGNLNMPPPGLPGPTVSNAEAAAALAAAQMMYPQFQSIVNYNPSGSPYLAQPQFYVPNVSSASAPTGGNQYPRGGGYQPAPALFGNATYEELQQMTSQAEYGKTNYVMPPPAPGKPVTSGSGSGMALGQNDVGNKYGAGMKGPYDSKQFGPATATPPPQLGYTQAATAPYGFSGYMQPVMNMMPGPAMPSNAQMTNDLLNQRAVNQNGKPPGGPGGVGKGMTQPYQYGTPWGN